MIDYLPNVISALAEATQTTVYYEAFNQKENIPCISVLEASNASRADGDTLRYSTLAYQIRIWSTRVSELTELALLVDDAMYSLGFSRTSSADLYEDELVTKVLRYEAISYERR